jgi:threonine dehydratase
VGRARLRHPIGSLKHRLARSLFLYALVNGRIVEGTTVVEASSGSTAGSEAYFARLIGVPFVAVLPRVTSPEKIALIERYGARCHMIADAGQVYVEAHRHLGRRIDRHQPVRRVPADRPDAGRGAAAASATGTATTMGGSPPRASNWLRTPRSCTASPPTGARPAAQT